MVAASELSIDTNANAVAMANEIFGDGVTVVGATYSGDVDSSGIYTGGDTTSPGVVPGSSGVILSTGEAEDFTNSSGSSNQRTNTSSNTSGTNNDSDFNALAGASTYDASILEVDFIPTGDTMTIQLVFSSEEFPEYATSVYNDTVGIWINGSFVALPNGDGETSVGNLDGQSAPNFYIDNANDDYNTEMDGFTLTLSLTIPVNPGVVNSIKIGIADVADSRYDSNLLIAGDSVQTTLVAVEDSESMHPNAIKTIDVLGNDLNNTAGTISITHINGVAVSPGDSVTLPTGQVITLNANGTLTVEGDGDNETISFTYGISSIDGSGTTLQEDVGIVTIEQAVPCFVAGTMIDVPGGQVPVETLTPGDLVCTVDNGVQPLRWSGRRKVAAEGKLAPIRIQANTFGTHGDLLISPLHRVLVRDALAELLFGTGEVLVAAKDLVNDLSVTRVEGSTVEYVHLLFDDHQVVWSEGLPTESFLPGPQTTKLFEKEIVDEICAIFPELDPDTGMGYSPAARQTLKSWEAQVLLKTGSGA